MPEPFALAGASLGRRLRALPRSAWILCLGMFISKFGNFLNVFLVLYLTARGHSAFLAGVALGAVGLGSFLGNAVGGTVADTFGRRTAIVISMFGATVFTVIVPMLTNIWLIIGTVVLVGLFGQLYRPAAGAILVDTVPAELRLTAFTVLRMCLNVGMSVGPMVGGLLSGYSYTLLFIGNGIALSAFGLLALLMLPETRPSPDDDAPAASRGEGYGAVLRDRAMVMYLVSMFAVSYAYVQTTATMPLHVRDNGMDNSFYGLLLGLNALLCVVLELPLVRHLERHNSRHVIALGIVLVGLGVGATGFVTGKAALAVTVVIWTLGEVIYTPVSTTYPGMLAPEHLRGRYQGAEGVAVTLAQAAGPALGGLTYAASADLHWLSCVIVSLIGVTAILLARHERIESAHTAEVST
jgi:MFS family permease